jgi:lipopolysaccharide/colanic/teichoic acid biosynthesis glycosyltransferase
VLLENTGPYERWGDVLAALKPGFIGPWWLSGHGRPAEVNEEIEADLNYARSYSIWLDLRILLAVGWALLTSWRHAATPGQQRHGIGAPVNAADED